MRQVPHVPLLLALSIAASLVAIAGCRISGPVGTRDGGDGDGSRPLQNDTDGDFIGDDDEGRGAGVDTDGDTIPDFEDDDSDGDGIPDSIEAGDADVITPPRDADSDGTPDFRDTDADGNGIPDGSERDGDVDGDLIPNFADTDDDGDFIPDTVELAGNTASPPDFDMDGNADFQDNDSDNDTISDNHEANADTDNDGAPDANDLDSDRDGVTDAVEAGDADVATVPQDYDMDGTPNFRDPDSDNDGLSDGDEAFEHGTSPVDDDSDDDGVTDLIEIGAETDPNDVNDSPLTRGDFFFLVPYMENPTPERDTLTFRTSIQFADVYFLFDASGSMDGEQDNLAAGVATILNNLTCADTGVACTGDMDCTAGNICSPFTSRCIEDPSTSACILSLWTGAGQYGQSASSGNLMINRTSLQPDPAVTSAGIALIPEDGGTEPLYGAIWAVVEPTGGSPTPASSCAAAMAGRRGCPAFRDDAVRILVAFTDEDSDGDATASQAANALTRTGVTLIGVPSASPGRSALVPVATMSGSVDSSGNPLVFDASTTGTGIETVVTDAINEIVEGVPLRVTIAAAEEPGDDGDALQFIDQLVTNTTGTGCSPEDTEDANGDGVHETYPSVTPGTPVCWDVVPARNETVMPAATPLVFKARLTVSGDGSPLDSRLVYFLVPPAIPDPGGPD